MTLLKKLSLAAASVAAFLALGSFGIDAAQAALYKYSFSGEDANGYFIYDTDTEADSQYESISNRAFYPNAVKEYKVDLGSLGLYQGTTADANIYLLSSDINPEIPAEYDSDVFSLVVQSSDSNAFWADFYFQEGSFGQSVELPTSVPSAGYIDIKPNVTGGETREDRGESLLRSSVTAKIEKIPEPTSSVALLGAGAWFILRRRQRQQTQLKNCIPNLQ
ncbi:MAG: PEP-CTERM sorting domain-containing protein [Brasilonema sp.]